MLVHDCHPGTQEAEAGGSLQGQNRLGKGKEGQRLTTRDSSQSPGGTGGHSSLHVPVWRPVLGEPLAYFSWGWVGLVLGGRTAEKAWTAAVNILPDTEAWPL